MIEVRDLTKRYGGHVAVSGLSFTVKKGSICGFLGPNGAGKSTTLNIMTGCLAASSGTVKICGYDIFEEAAQAQKHIGYLPEQPPLYTDRTPREYLTFVARARGLKRAEVNAQVSAVMEKTGLTDAADRLIGNLSKGYRQRVGIAQALVGDPEIVILDEPTVGLDPRQITEIRELIRSLGGKHTVILSSHILSEIRAVCTDVLILSHGKLAASDTPDNLEKIFAGRETVEIVAECSEEETEKILASVSGATLLRTETEESGRTRATVEPHGDTQAVCREIFYAFSRAGRPILGMHTVRAGLEDVFLELTSGENDSVETVQSVREEESV